MRMNVFFAIAALCLVAFGARAKESDFTLKMPPPDAKKIKAEFFGVTLGKRLPDSTPRVIRDDGIELHQFNPSNAFRKFTTYVVCASPIMHYIFEISAEGQFDNLSDARGEFYLTLHALEKKYGVEFDKKKKNDREIAWVIVPTEDDYILISLLVSLEQKPHLLQLKYKSGRWNAHANKEWRQIMAWVGDIALSKSDQSGL